MGIKGQPHTAGFERATYTKDSSQREAATYETIYKAASPGDTPEETALKEMAEFTPKFHKRTNQGGKTKIEIENLLNNLGQANYMDIKIGASTVT